MITPLDPTATLALYGVPASVLILGIVQVARESGLPSRFAPLLSIAVGVLIGIASQYPLKPHDYLAGSVIGLVAGLAASGIFSGVQKMTQSNAPVVKETVAP